MLYDCDVIGLLVRGWVGCLCRLHILVLVGYLSSAGSTLSVCYAHYVLICCLFTLCVCMLNQLISCPFTLCVLCVCYWASACSTSVVDVVCEIELYTPSHVELSWLCTLR